MRSVTEEEIIQIKADLLAAKSAKRRSAAKKIAKYQIVSLGNDLLEAYLRERNDARTWETQTAMIHAFGKIGYKAALPFLKEIVDANKDSDTITCYAALSYIRLTRTCANDMDMIIQFLSHGNTMLFDGAAMALAYDDVLPSEQEMKTVLKILDERKEIYERPCSNPIPFLISAMYRWSPELALPFLEQYKNDPRYAHIVQKTLAGKRHCRE